MTFHTGIAHGNSGGDGTVEADFPRIIELPEDDEEQPIPPATSSYAGTHSGTVDGHGSDTSSESSDFAEETLYDVIGVDRHASRHEIKKAFKAQIQITKDILATTQSAVSRNNAVVRASQLKAAYRVLRDAADRAVYDARTTEVTHVMTEESSRNRTSQVIPVILHVEQPQREMQEVQAVEMVELARGGQPHAESWPLITEVNLSPDPIAGLPEQTTTKASGQAVQLTEAQRLVNIDLNVKVDNTLGDLRPLGIMTMAGNRPADSLHHQAAAGWPSRIRATGEMTAAPRSTDVGGALVRRPPPAPTQAPLSQVGQASAASTALVRRSDSASSRALEQFRHSRNLSRDLTVAAERDDAGSAGWSFGGDFTLKGYGLRVSTVNRVIEYDSSGNQAYGREESRMLERDNNGRTRARESIQEMQGTSGQVSQAMQQLRSQGVGLLQSNPAALEPYGGFYSKRRY